MKERGDRELSGVRLELMENIKEIYWVKGKKWRGGRGRQGGKGRIISQLVVFEYNRLIFK